LRAVFYVCRPHHFNYTDGMYAVNEHFQRVDGPTYAPATVDKIALHHYVLKSEQVPDLRTRVSTAGGSSRRHVWAPLNFDK
jgi:hypothetical protein